MNFRNPIDPEIFADLLALQEATHPTLIQELAELFFTSATDGFEKMSLALKKGDMPTLRGIAHGLKSSAANLGASELSRLCFTLERMESTEVPNAEVHALVASIQQEYAVVERALHQQMKLNAAS